MTQEKTERLRRSSMRGAALALGMLIVLNLPRPAAADPCGFGQNGLNWVSQCVSQLDTFYSNAWIILRIGGVELPEIHVQGNTTIDRRARTPTEPVLDTEIIEMRLEGSGFTVTEPFGQRSLGMVTQNADGIGASGFYNVFFEIDGPFPFGPLHNSQALHVMTLPDKPLLFLPPGVQPPVPEPTSPVNPLLLPGFPYVYDCRILGPCVGLFDDQNILRAEVVSVIHLPKVPEPSTLVLLGAGLIALARRARNTRHRGR